VAILSNGGSRRYLIEVESTTGFVAYRLLDGTTLVSEAAQMSLPASEAVAFWSCAGYQDTSHAGGIVSLDCHDCGLTYLDAALLADLEYLDCSFNALTSLPLANLAKLQALDIDHNQLATLDVSKLRELRMLNCAGNKLTALDLANHEALEILDCSDNPTIHVHLEGCPSLRDIRGVP